MNRFAMLMIVMSMLPVLTFADARGSESPGKRFFGLWEGIDPLDGSSQQILISGGADGVFASNGASLTGRSVMAGPRS